MLTQDTFLVRYANNARIDIDGSTIRADGRAVADLDSSTRFVVNNGDGTYSTYTGTANLPDFAAGTVEVFWSVAADGVNGAFTQNVYVKDYVEQATFGTHLFALTDAHSWKLTEGQSTVYAMNVIVDGVERMIKTTSENVIDLLEANTGKLFHVDFDRDTSHTSTYGYVEDVWLVNEKNDGWNNGSNDGCNYLSDIQSIGNNAIKGDNVSYNLSYATEIIYSDKAWEYGSLKEAVENGCDVWVVDDVDGISSKAFTVYVGTALSDNANITVSAYGEANNIANAPALVDDNTYSVTLNDRNTAGKLSIGAANDYALYRVKVGANDATLYRGDELATTGLDNLKYGDTITVVAYPEDGSDSVTWTINVDKYVMVANAITSVQSSGGSVIVGGQGNLPMYSDFNTAVKNAVQLNSGDIGDITITANNSVVVRQSVCLRL